MALSALPIVLLAALVSAQSADAVACSSNFPSSLSASSAKKEVTISKAVFATKDFKYCENDIAISDASKWRLTCTAKLYPGSYIRVEEPAKANPMAYFCNGDSDKDGLDAEGSCGADRCFSILLAKKTTYKLMIGSEYYKLKDDVKCKLEQEKTQKTYAMTPVADSDKILKPKVNADLPATMTAASKAVTDTVTAAAIKTELAKLKEVKKIVTVNKVKVEVRFRGFEVVGTDLLMDNVDSTDTSKKTRIEEVRKLFKKDNTGAEHLGLLGAKYKINPATKLKATFTAAGKVAGTIEYTIAGGDSYIAAVMKLGYNTGTKKITNTLVNLELMLTQTLNPAATHTCEATNKATCDLIAEEIKKADFAKTFIPAVFEATKANNIYFLQQKIGTTTLTNADYFGFLFNNLVTKAVVDQTSFAAYQNAIAGQEAYATNTYNAKLGLEGTHNFKATTTIKMESIALDTSEPKYKFELKITNLEVENVPSAAKNDKLKAEVIYEVKVTLAADYTTATVTSATVKTTSTAAINALDQTKTTEMACVDAHQGTPANTGANYCKKWKDFLVTDPKLLEKFAENVKTDPIVKLFYDYVMKPVLAA